MKKILTTATYYSTYCSKAKALLEEHGYEVIENKTPTPYLSFEELKKIVPTIDGVVAGLDTWNEDVFKIAKNLKIIARFGVGYDNIDIAKAREYGIKVTKRLGGKFEFRRGDSRRIHARGPAKHPRIEFDNSDWGLASFHRL